MEKRNSVFIAISIDGYIADVDGGIDWLNSVPNPENIDMGYRVFMEGVDALLMGRNTFEKVLSFGIPWPYEKPVYILSSSLEKLPDEIHGKAEIVNGTPKNILHFIHKNGFGRIYIDGGQTIQSFLKEDLIDEITITRIPVILGGGFSLFGELSKPLDFELIESKVFLGQIVQDTYLRKHPAS